MLVKRLFLPWLLGLLVVIPVILPFFQPSYFRVHDFTHAARLAELYRSFQAGQFPPRWSQNFGFGYGMPLFSFYAPLPYYVGAIFHWIGFDFVTAVKLMFMLTFYFSFVAMFYLAWEYFKTAGALAAATLFTYIPYRAVDVYVRGALGELWGILFIVVSLLALVRLAKQPSNQRVAFAALSIAGILLSHNLMTIIGIPLLIFFAVVANRTNLKYQLTSLILGFGLASFFFIPAVIEKAYTSVDQLTQGGGEYSQHFVYLKQLIRSPFGYGGSVEGPHDGLSFEIGIVHLIVSGIALILLLINWKRIVVNQKLLVIFCVISLAVSVFVMSFHSRLVWENVPVLHYLQFPWRLLVIPMIVTPLLGAFVVSHFRATVGIIIISLIVLYIPINRPDPTQSAETTLYDTNPLYIRNQMSTVIPDYIHPQLSHLVLSQTKDITPASSSYLVSDLKAQSTVVADRSGYLKVSVQATKPYTFTAQIFDFPGWKWWVDGQQIEHRVDTPLPTMSFELPAGTSVIEGRLTETPLRMVADIISLGSMVVLSVLIFRKHNA